MKELHKLEHSKQTTNVINSYLWSDEMAAVAAGVEDDNSDNDDDAI